VLQLGRERLAREVHAAWRDGMIAQGREVAPERMEWETLSDHDRDLDRYIGERMASLLVAAWQASSL
jgi:hypothetical protein